MAAASVSTTAKDVSQCPAALRRFLTSSYAPALLSALLLWLSFFPVDWGWLGWLALVPLLSVIADPLRPHAYPAAWLCGLAFGLPALQWIRLASPPMYATWIGLAVFLSLHFLLFAWLTRQLMVVRLPLLVAAPAAWTGLEYVRAHIGIGFPWYYLGHTQHGFLTLLQCSDLFGAYGLSFLVVMVNVALFQAGRMALAWRGARRQAQSRWDEDIDDLSPLTPPSPLRAGLALVLAVVLMAAGIGYGQRRLGQEQFQAGPRIALIQGNLPQDIRNDPDEEEKVARHFSRLAHQAASAQPDLIVWSETSFVDGWYRIGPGAEWDTAPEEMKKLHHQSTDIARQVAKVWPFPTLLGTQAVIWEWDGQHRYNSALLVGGDGLERARYDKIYRIPFGEYVPWEKTLPFMRWFTPYETDYSISPGLTYTVFELPGRRFYRFSVLICYEDTVPHLARAFLHTGAEAAPDFFVNISNDGWFKGSEEHEQHLVSAVFRAVECRRPVARAVNMGISCVIDGSGRVVAALGPNWRESKAVEGVVVAVLPIDSRSSFYARWGDLLPWACWFLCAPGLVMALLIRRRREAATETN